MSELTGYFTQSSVGWSAITAIATLFIAVAAVVSAVLTRELIRENIRLRQMETEPEVIAYLHHHPHLWEFIDFVLANVGRGPARNVSFRFLADEDDFESHETALRNSPERTPLGFIPPGETYRAFFGTGTDLMKEPRLRPFDVEISYEDAKGSPRCKRFTLDMAQFEGMSSIGTPPTQDAADSLKKISRFLERIGVRRHRLLVETTTAEEAGVKVREDIQKARKTQEAQ